MATEEPLTSFDDGTLHIDFVQQEVTVDGEPVDLKPPEYRLLVTLALHQGEVFTPEMLIELFWETPALEKWRIACCVSGTSCRGTGSTPYFRLCAVSATSTDPRTNDRVSYLAFSEAVLLSDVSLGVTQSWRFWRSGSVAKNIGLPAVAKAAWYLFDWCAFLAPGIFRT